MDFLTKRTQFQCVASPAVMFTISASGKVTHNNSTVLTKSAKLTGNGICQILTAMAQGVPQPCQFQQTAWIAFDMTRKANGENLLTDKSFCNCSQCPSVIKVRAALAFGFQSGNFSAQTAQAVAALPPLDNENKSIKADNLQATNLQATSSKLQAESKQENDVAAAKNTANENVAESSEKFEYSLKCLNCDKKNCKYYFDGTIKKSSEQPSKQLTDNYIKYFTTTKKFNAADIIYRDSVKLKGAWSYQAHHIIPRDEAFAKVPELVEVATFCGYDINCAENCIMLPSRQPGHGQLDIEGKYNSTFEVMAQTGMQVHLGPHDRTDYAKRLIKELQKIKIPPKGEVCPATIIKELNKVSAKVRNKLVKFKENPMSSSPYYVSDFARKYALESLFTRAFASVRGHAKRFVGRVIGTTKLSNNAQRLRNKVLKTKD